MYVKISAPMTAGSTSSRPRAPINADQLNTGTRRMFMPGARVVSTVVARDPAAATRPSRATMRLTRNSPTNFASPPPGPPLAAIDTTTSTAPMNHVQKPAAASRGNVSDRAPSCSGTTAMAMPSNSGTSTTNVSPILYSANNCGMELMSSIAASASMRSMPSNAATTITPSRPTSDTEMNNRPMRLWSVVVSQSLTDDKRAPADAEASAEAPAACVSMVVIGWELFSLRARKRTPDSALDRLLTIGLHLRDYP